MTHGGNEATTGDPGAAADGLTNSTNVLTLTQEQKLYLAVLDVFGSQAAPANAARDKSTPPCWQMMGGRSSHRRKWDRRWCRLQGMTPVA